MDFSVTLPKLSLRGMVRFRENDFTVIQEARGGENGAGSSEGIANMGMPQHEHIPRLSIGGHIQSAKDGQHYVEAMSWLNKDVDILFGVIQVICGKYPTGIWDVVVAFPKQYIHTVATHLAPDSQCRAHTPMFGVYSVTDRQSTYPGILVGINMNVYNSRFREC